MSAAALWPSGSFRRLLGVRPAGTAVNQMLLMARGWQMYDLTGCAWGLALVGLVQFLPTLLLTIPAEQRVDRGHSAVIGMARTVQVASQRALLPAWPGPVGSYVAGAPGTLFVVAL